MKEDFNSPRLSDEELFEQLPPAICTFEFERTYKGEQELVSAHVSFFGPNNIRGGINYSNVPQTRTSLQGFFLDTFEEGMNFLGDFEGRMRREHARQTTSEENKGFLGLQEGGVSGHYSFYEHLRRDRDNPAPGGPAPAP